MPDRSYYIDSSAAALRQQYQAFVASMLKLANISDAMPRLRA